MFVAYNQQLNHGRILWPRPLLIFDTTVRPFPSLQPSFCVLDYDIQSKLSYLWTAFEFICPMHASLTATDRAHWKFCHHLDFLCYIFSVSNSRCKMFMAKNGEGWERGDNNVYSLLPFLDLAYEVRCANDTVLYHLQLYKMLAWNINLLLQEGNNPPPT